MARCVLTVKEHSRGPEVALGKWLNLFVAMFVISWSFVESELCCGVAVAEKASVFDNLQSK